MTLKTEDAYNKIIRLSTHVDQNFIELGRLLRQLKERDKELFKQVCEDSGLGRRKGYYLVAIVKQFEGLPITDAQLASIGWTKAEIIGKHVTTDNWPELLAEAQQRSTRDLKIIMSGGQPVRGTKCVVLYLKPNHYERFQKAIKTHGGKVEGGSLKNKERALMNIIVAAEQAAS